MGSPLRIAAAACVVASGLLAGAANASLALADPLPTSGDSGDKHTNGPLRNGSIQKPKSHPDEKKTTSDVGGKKDKKDQSGTDPGEQKAGDEENDGDADNGKDGGNGNAIGGNRGNKGNNGKCGNSGNAYDCGGGSGNGDGEDDLTPATKPPPNTEKPPPATEEPDWPSPWNPGEPPGSGGGRGGVPGVPSGRPHVPPQMLLPPELMTPATEPVGPSVIDVAPGVGVAAAELPIPPVTLPVIVALATGLGGGGGSPGVLGPPALPGAPRGDSAEPPAGREPLPANVGSNVAAPASAYQIPDTDYLRDAGLSQVVALAVPGIAGMLVLTGAGGLVGYRQAKAGHAVHTSGTARFVN